MSHSAKDWERPGLTPTTRAIASAAIDAFLANREGVTGPLALPEPAWRDRCVRSCDLHFGACSAGLRFALGVLVLLLEWLPCVIVGRARRMSRLALDERVRYLEALEQHRVALFALLLVGNKMPMLFAAFEEGDALAATGFDRPTSYARRRLTRTDVTRTDVTRTDNTRADNTRADGTVTDKTVADTTPALERTGAS